jgi:hypothetical protein
MRGRVLSSTVPAHRMCQILFIVFTFCDAGLHTHEGSIALKYRACAQNVSGPTHILLHFEMLSYTQIRGQVLSSTVPAHRMCQVLLHFFHFGMLPYTQMRGQVFSSTVPAHRMCQAILQFSHFGMLAYTKMRAQVLSSTVPAHRMCHTLLIVFTFMDAALQPDEGSSALKYRACAQHVSHPIYSFYILRRWSTHR